MRLLAWLQRVHSQPHSQWRTHITPSGEPTALPVENPQHSQWRTHITPSGEPTALPVENPQHSQWRTHITPSGEPTALPVENPHHSQWRTHSTPSGEPTTFRHRTGLVSGQELHPKSVQCLIKARTRALGQITGGGRGAVG